MFSSLEKLPDDNNCTTEWTEWEVQVTRNGATGHILANGKPQLHMTSPIVVETHTDNEDDGTTIKKLTVNTEIEISEILEERDEECIQERDEPDDVMHHKEENQVETEEVLKEKKEETEKEQQHHDQVQQEAVKIANGSAEAHQPTPAVSSSRYDKVYRRKERPFGATYRRREQQQREKLKQSTEDCRQRQQPKNVEYETTKEKEVEEIEQKETIRESVPVLPQEASFYEDEYCYEPENKLSTSKTVLRTRSMINLDADEGKTFVRKTLSDVTLSDSNHVTDNKICNGNLKTNGINGNFRYMNAYNSKSTTNISTLPPSGLHRPRPVSMTSRQISSSTMSLRRHDDFEREEDEEDQEDNDQEVLRRRLRQMLSNDRLVIEPRRSRALDTATMRRCFYHPVRINRELIDEELPDPDQVKLARDKFEKVLKIKGPDAPRQLSILTRTASDKRPTPEVRLPPPITTPAPKWTDTGSLSSGVSSGGEDSASCEDDLHEVSSEIMNRIRACGTTVTYYGGKVISQSSGPPSPLTSTIMEEIKFRLEVRDRMQFQEDFTTRGQLH